MLKLRFSKPFHKQYMDGKVSVCKYECQIVDNLTKDVVSEFTVTGTAKCSPNDTVNPEFGQKLADSRAKLAAYKRANNRYPKYMLLVSWSSIRLCSISRRRKLTILLIFAVKYEVCH